jgi:hypothetical protein
MKLLTSIVTAIFFLSGATAFAQCTAFNVNINSKGSFYNLSDPIKCANGDFIITAWYIDSIGVNLQKVDDKVKPNAERSTIFRVSKEGKVLQQLSLADRFPYLHYGPYIDNLENVYVPVVNLPNKTLTVTDAIVLPSQKYSTFGLVKISKDFQAISYTQLGITPDGANINPLNIVPNFKSPSQKGYVSIVSESTLYLENGAVLKQNSDHAIHLIELNSNLKIVAASSIAESKMDIWNLGFEQINNKLLALFQYTDTMYIQTLSKIQIPVIRSVYNLPSKQYPGNDIAIFDITDGVLNKSYNIGCPGRLRIAGYNTKLHYSEGRYVFCFYNESNGIFDNLNKSMEGKYKDMRGVAVMDTSFNLLRYLPLEANADNAYTFLNLFKDKKDKLWLYTGANNVCYFQKDTIKIEDRTNLNSITIHMYQFNSDTFYYQKKLNSTDFSFRAFDYSNSELLCYLFKTDAKGAQNIWGNSLTSGLYNNELWFGRFCGDVLSIENGGLKSSYFELFPNPNSGSFNLKVSDPTIEFLDIKVMDALGRLIYQEKRANTPNGAGEVKIPENAIHEGVYFLNINDKFKERFIISR